MRERLRILIERHLLHTGSARAALSARQLGRDAWQRFVKVMPTDYAKALTELKRRALVPAQRRGGGIVMGKPTGFLEIERQRSRL